MKSLLLVIGLGVDYSHQVTQNPQQAWIHLSLIEKKKEKTSSLISTDWSANCQILSASELQGISRLRIPANLANLCAF